MQVVDLREPDRVTTCVTFASPHSGRHYPEDLRARTSLPERFLRSSEDAYMDELAGCAPRYGAPFLTSDVPRAYVDFNRDESEIDPILCPGAPRGPHNPRIASGLGVVARVVSQGRPIYRDVLSLSEARRRIERCWHPYHAALSGLLLRQRARFGRALLIDMHSMPHDALTSRYLRGAPRPDVILGDRHGKSCRPETSQVVGELFRQAGFAVAFNAPFAGGYITQRYGRPEEGLEAIQVEIDRRLYLDEQNVVRGEGFAEMQARLEAVIAALAELGRSRSASVEEIAAE